MITDALAWADKVKDVLGSEAIECHFAKDQVHTFAIGGWLADPDHLELSDHRLLSFVKSQTELNRTEH